MPGRTRLAAAPDPLSTTAAAWRLFVVWPLANAARSLRCATGLCDCPPWNGR